MREAMMADLTIRMSAAFLLAILAPSAASAAAGKVSGSAALALAGVVAPYSTVLSARDKKTVAALFDGNAAIAITTKNQLLVNADSVLCRISNVDITFRSCELIFSGRKHGVKGRAANEIYATLALAGADAEGAAGSIFLGVTKLSCTLDPPEIKEKSGGGAECSFRTGE
jgi:hypothetical protein